MGKLILGFVKFTVILFMLSGCSSTYPTGSTIISKRLHDKNIDPSLGRVIISLKKSALLDSEKKLIAHPMCAGVILFGRNHERNGNDKLKRLVADIQKIAIRAGKTQGLPVFVDQEGGYVQRFKTGFTPLPAPETFGIAYDINPKFAEKLISHYAQKMSSELLNLGIITLAPVLDLQGGNVVIEGYGRAFHKDPVTSSKIAAIYIDAMNKSSMPATAKHFPGHGRNIGDSHEKLPVDKRELKDIENSDLVPFISLISKNKLHAIMPAHIIYPAIDPKYTAGASKIWIQDLLRGKYGFDGVVISDCLTMAAAQGKSEIEKVKIALMHSDVVLFCEKDNKNTAKILDELLKEYKQYKMPYKAKIRYDRWTSSSLARRMQLATEKTF